MDAVLIDTDVFSYLIRPNDPRGDAFEAKTKAGSPSSTRNLFEE
jgi:hypothetical protein